MKSDNDKIVPLIRIVDDDMDLLEGLAYMLEGEGWEVKTYPTAESFLVLDDSSMDFSHYFRWLFANFRECSLIS